MKSIAWFLTPILFLVLYSSNSIAAECKFKSVKTEIRGDVREIYKCRDGEAQDCELLGTIAKADIDRYSKVVDQSRMTNDLFLMAVTAPIGGMALSGSKVGGLLMRFGKDAWKSFKAPLGTPTKPFAGLFKDHVGQTFGPRAAEIFSRSTYVSSALPFGGAIAITTDSVRNKISSAASFVAGDRTPSGEVADKALGDKAGDVKPDGSACVDKGVKQLENSLALVKTHENAESLMAQCMAMPLGGRRAQCLHEAQQAARQHFLVKHLGTDGAREASKGYGAR